MSGEVYTIGKHSCFGCQKIIGDQFLSKVLDKIWHDDCIRCFTCQKLLREKCFSRDYKLYCRDDFYRYTIVIFLFFIFHISVDYCSTLRCRPVEVLYSISLLFCIYIFIEYFKKTLWSHWELKFKLRYVSLSLYRRIHDSWIFKLLRCWDNIFIEPVTAGSFSRIELTTIKLI